MILALDKSNIRTNIKLILVFTNKAKQHCFLLNESKLSI